MDHKRYRILLREIVIGQRQVALRLTVVHAPYAITHGVDHVELNHRLHQERVAVTKRHTSVLDVVSQAPQPLPGVWSGQGFSADTPTKLAVENAAMNSAREHYESEQWTVIDVSAKKSFDLLCTKGDEELHVEVKGTTQAPKGVFLTANEVAHAEHPDTRVALFILSGIAISKQDGKPVASGGTKTVLDPFELKRERLTAKQYTYSLDGLA